MIAFFQRGDARADIDHDAGALMAEDGRKQAFRVGARQREFVGMADAGRLDLDQHFAGARAVELDRHDFEWLACLHGNGGAYVHCCSPSSEFAPQLQSGRWRSSRNRLRIDGKILHVL